MSEDEAGGADEGAGVAESVSESVSGDVVDKSHRVADGLKISYRIYEPQNLKDGASAGAPVVCLHGLTRNLRDFEDVAPYIAAEGRLVIAASMRGRGRSSWDEDPTHYAPPVYAADVVSLLDALKIPRAVFLGTSMGGIITMVIAATEPDRVAAAILNDIGPELAPEGLARIRSYAGKVKTFRNWYQAAQSARRINGPAFPNEREEAFWEAFARRTCVETPEGVAPAYDPAISEGLKSETASAAFWPVFDALIGTPTLLVRGALSDLLSAETAAEMRARKPDLRYAEVPDVGHAPMLNESAARDAIVAFLDDEAP